MFLTHDGFGITANVDDFALEFDGRCKPGKGAGPASISNKECTGRVTATQGDGVDQIFNVQLKQLDWNTPRVSSAFENDFAMLMSVSGSDKAKAVEVQSGLAWEQQGADLHAKGSIVARDTDDLYLGAELHHFYSSPTDLMLAATVRTVEREQATESKRVLTLLVALASPRTLPVGARVPRSERD
jgi:hypothetical protein